MGDESNTCPDCGAAVDSVAAFCFRCGRALGPSATPRLRGRPFAIHASEHVRRFALLSTVLPHANRRISGVYRWAFLAMGLVVLVFAAAGVVSAAIVAGALVVPVTYLVYLYDVNVWEDTPLVAVLLLFVLTGLLAIVVSLVFFRWFFDAQLLELRAFRGTSPAVSLEGLLLFAGILPILAEMSKNVGPVFLARRPMFDDLIDGFTFGVAAGTAYAAAETLVAFSGALSGGADVQGGIGEWVPIVLNLMIVKPLVYGTATGIAAASFSGRGEGYDGFTRRYAAGFAFAAAMNVLYWLGIRLLSSATFGEVLGLLWGLLILAVLVLRARVILHAALLEAALEAAVEGRRPRAAAAGSADCPECEMPLYPDALFCVACGVSVRATSPAARRHIRQASGAAT